MLVVESSIRAITSSSSSRRLALHDTAVWDSSNDIDEISAPEIMHSGHNERQRSRQLGVTDHVEVAFDVEKELASTDTAATTFSAMASALSHKVG